MPVGDALWGTPDQLINAAKQAGASATNLEGYMQRTETQVQTLVAGWQAPQALPVFMQKHEEWRGSMTSLITELRRIERGTQQSAGHQTQAEEASKQAVNRPVSTGLKPV
jgi:WXG100 family type VII secretion target